MSPSSRLTLPSYDDSSRLRLSPGPKWSARFSAHLRIAPTSLGRRAMLLKRQCARGRLSILGLALAVVRTSGSATVYSWRRALLRQMYLRLWSEQSDGGGGLLLMSKRYFSGI